MQRRIFKKPQQFKDFLLLKFSGRQMFFALFLRVAGAAHGAIGTPASTGGFSIFFVAYHAGNDGSDHSYQHRAYNDGCYIFRNPCKGAEILVRDDIFGSTAEVFAECPAVYVTVTHMSAPALYFFDYIFGCIFCQAVDRMSANVFNPENKPDLCDFNIEN